METETKKNRTFCWKYYWRISKWTRAVESWAKRQRGSKGTSLEWRLFLFWTSFKKSRSCWILSSSLPKLFFRQHHLPFSTSACSSTTIVDHNGFVVDYVSDNVSDLSWPHTDLSDICLRQISDKSAKWSLALSGDAWQYCAWGDADSCLVAALTLCWAACLESMSKCRWEIIYHHQCSLQCRASL